MIPELPSREITYPPPDIRQVALGVDRARGFMEGILREERPDEPSRLFKPGLLQEAHKRLLFYYPGFAGQFRGDDEVGIAGRNVAKARDLKLKVYLFERWLENQMNGLKQEADAPDSLEKALYVASAAHYAIVGELHPFDDGSGRVARLVTNFALMQNADERRFHKYFILPVPLIREQADDREIARLLAEGKMPKEPAYLQVLRQVDQDPRDLGPLEGFLAGKWVESIDRFMSKFNSEFPVDDRKKTLTLSPTDLKLVATIRRRRARLTQITEMVADGSYPKHAVPYFYTTQTARLAA